MSGLRLVVFLVILRFTEKLSKTLGPPSVLLMTLLANNQQFQ